MNLRGNPYIGTAGVFLGAGIVSLSQRMLSVGLPDLRGAFGLGFDEAAWIPTACNMALMFMGAFSVYLGALLGPRRVLLATGPIYVLISLLLPYAPNLEALLVLQVLAGLTSGTFYPQSMSYALRALPPRYTIYGIGAYSMELISTLSIATPLQAWSVEHGSWRWMFWISAILTSVMMLCIYLAVPHPAPRQGPKPVVHWQGFFYASLGLALVEGALEQGERLDWFGSPLIIAMLATGAFLILAAAVQRWFFPNPLVNLSFLVRRNTLLLGFGIFSLRFTLLAVVYLVPGYLGVVQSYRPLETGAVLLGLLLPVLGGGLLAARLMQFIEGRVIAGLGFATVAFACALDSRMSSVWSGENFSIPQFAIAMGLAFVFVGVIGMVVQQGLETGIVTRPVDALTYASFFQTVRLLGGQAGTSALQRIVVVRERFHSNMLGLNVRAGDWLTDERLRSLAAGVFPGSVGLDDSQSRAGVLLSLQLSREAYTLSYSDGFLVVAWLCASFLVAIACLRRMNIYFDSPLRERSI
jgi:DHA2 family multidrug resistance protein